MIFYITTTFSTPYAIGNSYWGYAYADLEPVIPNDDPEPIVTELEEKDSENTTNSTKIGSNSRIFAVEISEGLTMGDGSKKSSDLSQEKPQILTILSINLKN